MEKRVAIETSSPAEVAVGRMPVQKLLSLGIIAFIGLILLFHLLTLTKLRPLFIDEPMFSNFAYNWLQTGVNFDTMHTGPLDQFGSPGIYRPLLAIVPWSLSFSVFGLGFTQARMVSWVFGVIATVATYWVGRRLYGNLTGLIAALLLTLSLPFMQAIRYARADMYVTAILLISFGLVITAFEREKAWMHFLAGLLMGLTSDIHFNGLLFIPGIAVLYLMHYGFNLWRKPGTWLIGLGGALGLLFYVVVHILPDPEVYSILYGWDAALARTLDVPITNFNLRTILSSLRDELGRYHFYDNNLDFALIGAGFLWLLVRGRKADRRLIVYIVLAVTFFALMVFHQDNLYAILFYPFLLLVAAEALTSLFDFQNWRKAANIFALGLVIFTLINSVEHLRRSWSETAGYDYDRVANQIAEVIPDDARVLGMPHWWFAMSDMDYRSTFSIFYYNFFNDYSFLEVLDVIHPDYIIVDKLQREWLTDSDEIAFGYPGVPREKLFNFLDEFGEQVTEIDDPWHGPVTVYRISWDTENS